MCTLNKVYELIRDEQSRQMGNFIPEISEYLQKLSTKAELYVSEVKGNCAGFVFFYCNDPKKFFSYISLLMVAPECRGRGVGAELVRQVIATTESRGFSKCRLEVRKDNFSAIRLYRDLGFYTLEECGEKYLMEAVVKKSCH